MSCRWVCGDGVRLNGVTGAPGWHAGMPASVAHHFKYPTHMCTAITYTSLYCLNLYSCTVLPHTVQRTAPRGEEEAGAQAVHFGCDAPVLCQLNGRKGEVGAVYVAQDDHGPEERQHTPDVGM